VARSLADAIGVHALGFLAELLDEALHPRRRTPEVRAEGGIECGELVLVAEQELDCGSRALAHARDRLGNGDVFRLLAELAASLEDVAQLEVDLRERGARPDRPA
jgi:hypothetical protein